MGNKEGVLVYRELPLMMDGVDETLAREAFRLAASELPIQTTFVIRQIGA